MKKGLFYFVLFALCSCTDMNIKVQRIESPTDCVTNDKWSWNDGVAITTSGDNYYGGYTQGSFSFISDLSGILSFRYAFRYAGDGLPHLTVSLEGGDKKKEAKVCFSDVIHSSTNVHTDTIQVIIKNIRKKNTIKFVGHNCMVKDLMISSSLEEEKPEDNTSPNDF